jgi:hypothetical protein
MGRVLYACISLTGRKGDEKIGVDEKSGRERKERNQNILKTRMK